VDFLKIDGGFVKDMVRDPIDYAMVEASHRIGHMMGIKTVAESIENERIRTQLKAIGVNYAQGYEVGKPRPLALLPQLGLDFHKNKTFCVFNPLIFRTGIFRSTAKAPVVPT
jgi:EAL domain-containing protein (putative c-di-GMP-specific phosphodiesterase class I)